MLSTASYFFRKLDQVHATLKQINPALKQEEKEEEVFSPNFGGFHRTLQRVRLTNRGRLLHRTPGPVHLGLAFVLMLKPFFPKLVMSTDLLSFEHPSVLLFCL